MRFQLPSKLLRTIERSPSAQASSHWLLTLRFGGRQSMMECQFFQLHTQREWKRLTFELRWQETSGNRHGERQGTASNIPSRRLDEVRWRIVAGLTTMSAFQLMLAWYRSFPMVQVGSILWKPLLHWRRCWYPPQSVKKINFGKQSNSLFTIEYVVIAGKRKWTHLLQLWGFSDDCYVMTRPLKADGRRETREASSNDGDSHRWPHACNVCISQLVSYWYEHGDTFTAFKDLVV